MTITLDHTIVYAENKHESATFLASLFDLPEPVVSGPFLSVELGAVTLDFAHVGWGMAVRPQHLGFLVSDAEFDQIYARIRERGVAHWADARRELPDAINTDYGGRGVYFLDPSGHFLEILTRGRR